jgi:glycosyltransferase involved in cell wall biosynthesis
MNNAPRVSVIVPVRNCREYIHEALDSILTQSYTDFEIIVIDDGSDDFDYLSLQTLDTRIRVIRLEGVGVSRARNTGMSAARGELIAFLDADDVWFPGKLEAQVRYFERHPEVGVVFGRFIRWTQDESGSFAPAASMVSDCSAISDEEPARSGWIYDKLLMGLLVGMNTAMIRQVLFRRLGGFAEEMRIGEDYDFWLRAARITQMHALNGAVALYRIHSNSAMHRLSDINHMAVILRVTHARWGTHNSDGSGVSEPQFIARLAASEFEHGYAHYWHGKPQVAIKSFKSSLRGGYKRGRSLVYIILSLLKRRRTST